MHQVRGWTAGIGVAPGRRLERRSSRPRRRRQLLACLVLLAPVSAAAACPARLAALVPDAAVRAALADGGVQIPLGPDTPLRLIPATLAADATVRAPLQAIDPVYGAELLRLIATDTPACNFVALYNAMQSISTLQGIEYYSASRDRYRTLYRISHVIAGPRDRTPLPDPVATRVPAAATLHLLQEDLTFGRNVYTAELGFDQSSISMHMQNLTTMWWTILPLVEPRNFQSVVLITPTEAGLLFYAAAAIHTVNLQSVRERGQVSLANRLDALERWFRGHLTAVAAASASR